MTVIRLDVRSVHSSRIESVGVYALVTRMKITPTSRLPLNSAVSIFSPSFESFVESDRADGEPLKQGEDNESRRHSLHRYGPERDIAANEGQGNSGHYRTALS